MFFLRSQKRNDKQPLSNFEAEIVGDAKQLEAQPKTSNLESGQTQKDNERG